MTDIIEFLRARLDEDEQVARDAVSATWGVGSTQKVEWGPMKPWSEGTYRDVQGQIWPQQWTDDASHIYSAAPEKRMVADMTDSYTRPKNKPNAQHIARWDPARVLAEVEAKRTVLDVLARCANIKWTGTYAVVEEARRALHALTLPYVDHPDYDPTWGPVSNTV